MNKFVKRRGRLSKRKDATIIKGKTWIRFRKFAVTEAQPLLYRTKHLTKKDDPIIRKALTNYLIVRTVGMLEHFLINLFKEVCDENEKDVNLGDFINNPEQYQNKEKSKVIISTYSFSNPDDIQFVFSQLLHIDFFEAIKKFANNHAPYFSLEQEHIRFTKPIHKNWVEVIAIINMRHDIVHNNKTFVLQYHQLRNLIGGIGQLILSADMVSHWPSEYR